MATGHESGPTPSGGVPSQAAPAAARRGGRLWWVAAGLLAFLALGAALFVRQAIDRQRVETDLDLAAAAFAGARGADARELAPDEWLLATTRIDEAMAELHRQGGRFVLVRAYPRVHELLAKAIDAADAAKAAAESAREAAEEQRRDRPLASPGTEFFTPLASEVTSNAAETAADAARASFDGATAALARVDRCPRASQSKYVKKDLEAIRVKLESYRPHLAGIRDRMFRGDFAGARAQSETLKGQLDSIAKDLEGVLTKFKCK